MRAAPTPLPDGDCAPRRRARTGARRTGFDRRTDGAGAAGAEQGLAPLGIRPGRGIGGRRAAIAVGVAGGGGVPAADGVRERGQPAAGARRDAAQRDRAACGDGRGARAHRRAAADGEPAAGPGRRRGGAAAGGGRGLPAGACRAGQRAAAGAGGDRSAAVRIHARGFAGDRDSVRSGAGDAGLGKQPERDPQRRRPRRHRRTRRDAACAMPWW